MSEANNQQEPQEIRLRHRITGRLPSIFAQNLLIQTLHESVSISFYETILPPKAELTEEDIEQLKEVGVLAECVARIAMPPQAFIDAAAAMGRVAESIKAANAKKGEQDAKL
ncbi:MAG: hypothetical protein M3X11_23565 [Acidobacteriota bacterium]|nr:hypothetical protein [Acidobacteriota bacterium]